MSKELLWSDDRMRQVAFDRQSDFGVSAFWAAMDMAVQMRDDMQARIAELEAQVGVWVPMPDDWSYSSEENLTLRVKHNGATIVASDYAVFGSPLPNINQHHLPDGVRLCQQRTAPVEAQPDAQGDVWTPVPDDSLRYHAGLQSYMLDGEPIDFFSLPDNVAICRRTAPVEAQPVQPTIVCLCGSTRFWRQFQISGLEETLAGKIVLSIGSASGTDDEHFGHLSKEEHDRIVKRLNELHFRKIDMADEVLILNAGGYVGIHTQAELDYARKLGKRIRFLEPEQQRPAAEAAA